MNSKQILHLLHMALGEQTADWEVQSAYNKEGSFTVIRYDTKLTKGQLRRMHSLIEDTLSEHLGEGDRIR